MIDVFLQSANKHATPRMSRFDALAFAGLSQWGNASCKSHRCQFQQRGSADDSSRRMHRSEKVQIIGRQKTRRRGILPILRRSTTQRTGDTAWERSPRAVSGGAAERVQRAGKETAQRRSGPSRGAPASEENKAPSLSRDHRTTQKDARRATPLAEVLQGEQPLPGKRP